MRMYDIIQTKKEGGTHTAEELAFLVRGAVDGSIPDYQLSAWLMAVCFSGMTPKETADLTMAMSDSGDRTDLSRFGHRSVDKHSTGGVGDKTTLIVAPIAAAMGCKVAKMSGRGLGYTGGTADKLAAIPGYRITMPNEDFLSQVEKTGVSVVTQSGNLSPADKKLYALRDVTATVDSIPLIASSIMSKKLASGAHSIVLDVKVGSGAFMKTLPEAEALARAMVEIGTFSGRRVTAVLTNMDIPLGCAVGNTLEVEEAVAILRGEGPADLRDVSLELSAHMVSLALNMPLEEARKGVKETLESGKAFEKFREWIRAQGGTDTVFSEPFPEAPFCRDVTASRAGYVSSMDTEAIGAVSVQLGAGRSRAGEEIDPLAGIRIRKKTGDRVKAGEVLATLYTSDEGRLSPAARRYADAITLSDKAPENAPLLYSVINAE